MVKGIKGGHAGSLQRAERRRYLVETLTTPDRIRALLEPRRLYAAYAVGQLAPDLFPLVDCWRAEDAAGGTAALALFSRGGLGDALFMMGEADVLEALLSLHPGPRQNYVTCEPSHLDIMRRFYRLASERPMLRMSVRSDAFRAVAPQSEAVVRRMFGTDARLVNRLYCSEGSPTYYTSQQIEAGLYYGVVVDQRLVAVAGTHVVSPEEGIAVVGNVFTHPRWRGHGYATVATSATTAHLLRTCRDVVLTVDPENTPAVRAYDRLGYRTDSRLIEAAVTRRGLRALGGALRRLRARLRSHQDGVEVVVR
ncbi:MAG: GNAT family N-acetyltransferase [Dehalococcoidia bacterium]